MTFSSQTVFHLDSKQTQAFLSVIDSGSFEAAAQALHLTSSAVSQRLKALESALGVTLMTRSRPCRATPAGRKLLQHLRRVKEMEQDLHSEYAGEQHSALRVSLGVNADSVGSWMLPGLADFLIAENILLELIIDDQDHTHALLEQGLVLGCISAAADSMRGCHTIALGIMRYHAVASKAYCARWFPTGMTRSSAALAPVLCFNSKDSLQSTFLQRHFGLPSASYPSHFIPATGAYNQAIVLGLGWGLIPEVMLTGPDMAELVRLMPHSSVDVALYWHQWKVQTPRLQRLSAKLLGAAQAVLHPVKAPLRTPDRESL